MKKIVGIIIALSMLVAGNAFASDKILVPASKCDSIVSTTYSTGGGDQIIQYATITCKKGDKYYMMLAEKMSKAGMFGKITGSRTLGRMASASLYEIEITDKVDEVEFD